MRGAPGGKLLWRVALPGAGRERRIDFLGPGFLGRIGIACDVLARLLILLMDRKSALARGKFPV